MKTFWKLSVMTINYKVVLLLLATALFAGLTGCNQAGTPEQTSGQALERPVVGSQ